LGYLTLSRAILLVVTPHTLLYPHDTLVDSECNHQLVLMLMHTEVVASQLAPA